MNRFVVDGIATLGRLTVKVSEIKAVRRDWWSVHVFVGNQWIEASICNDSFDANDAEQDAAAIVAFNEVRQAMKDKADKSP